MSLLSQDGLKRFPTAACQPLLPTEKISIPKTLMATSQTLAAVGKSAVTLTTLALTAVAWFFRVGAIHHYLKCWSASAAKKNVYNSLVTGHWSSAFPFGISQEKISLRRLLAVLKIVKLDGVLA